MGIPAVGKIDNMFFVKPLEGVDAGTKARKTQAAGGPENSYNPFGAISGIDGEITPTLGTTGSSYTNGLGHSVHTKNWMF